MTFVEFEDGDVTFASKHNKVDDINEFMPALETTFNYYYEPIDT